MMKIMNSQFTVLLYMQLQQQQLRKLGIIMFAT